MIEKTIQEIEAKIASSTAINEEQKAELRGLLETLKSETTQLSKTHLDEAVSIAGFAEVSTHEAIRAEKNPKLLNLSLSGLEASVDGFEKTHPRLVDIVNSICTTLSNLGI